LYHDENAFPPNPFKHKQRTMTNTIDAPNRQVRFFELDSIRGLAALLVLVSHLEMVWSYVNPAGSEIGVSIVNLTLAFGPEAVILFFVLSGFVLSLPAVNGRPQTYPTFITRRIFRIYIPYLAALAIAVAGAYWLHGRTPVIGWPSPPSSERVDWHLVGQHILFLGFYNTDQFDIPIWSLVYEMRISLIFPLLCGFVLRFKSGWSFAIAAGLTIVAITLDKFTFEVAPGLADTFQYAGLFLFGIFLARERSRLGAWFQHRRWFGRVLIGVAFLLLFLFGGAPLNRSTGHLLHSKICISHWITAFGAGGLMIISMNSASCKRVLHWPPIHFLGQISYSLYLWHFVVLLYCVHLLYGKVSLWVILGLTFILSIFVSWLSYRFIELPSMNLGRRLSNAFPSPADARRTATSNP
jgi:peptidoglycan/LPS O-acetylase OafA/YrhL